MSDKITSFLRRVFGKSRVHLWQFRSLFLMDAIVIVAAVMAFGLLSLIAFDLNENNAIIMIFMVPFMAAAVGFSSHMLLKTVRPRMDMLLEATQKVADGDLDVELPVDGADEYTAIYYNFNTMVKELKATKEEMTSSVNVLAHEFKTPVTSVCGFADYLIQTGDGIETPERMEYLQIIHDESLRLSELSQNTLLLSKMEACQIVADKQEFDLTEQIQRCVILLLPQMEKKGIEPVLDLPELTYYGNPEMMEQIWINLLNNAVKFTPAGGTITVTGEILPAGDEPDSCSGRGASRRVCICVADTGCGMSRETAEHIFEKYYQNDTVSTVRGNGIGLAIVDRITHLCGGTVEVESRVGEGSTFRVCLPV